jgi:hypothetical protein
MADIKINSPGFNNIQELNKNAQLDKQLPRSGNFQGQTVNTISPPSESPLAVDTLQNKSLNAALAKPPIESPLTSEQNLKATKGYSLSEISGEKSLQSPPSDEALFDFALGKNKSAEISKYLEQNPAASKAVDVIRRASSEIGSLDFTPKLDSSIQSRLDNIASKIFVR